MVLEIGLIPKTAKSSALYFSPLPFPTMTFNKALLLTLSKDLPVLSTLSHERMHSLSTWLHLNDLLTGRNTLCPVSEAQLPMLHTWEGGLGTLN